MNKIIVRIKGGLGNQLFIYAAARRLALVNNAELVLDDVSGFVYDCNYERHYQLDHFHITCRKALSAERLEPFPRVRRYLKRRINQARSFERRSYIQQQQLGFDSRLLHIKPTGKLYLEGYWQSENYFSDIKAVIRQDLKIKPPTDIINQHMAKEICSHTAVAIHVRFFDKSESLDSTNNVVKTYYRRAIRLIEQSVPNAHFYLFSDHPEVAQERIDLPKDRITIVAHNQGDEMAYADLWLMRQCQHFIIANSTFSWWGAWLSDYNDKQIIAPGFKLANLNGVTSWNFPGQLPNYWHKL